jgi:hypothetical protein
MKTPILILIASLLVSLVPWFNALSTWGAMFTPVNVGAFFGIVGGVLLAWLGASPIKPKQ